MDDFETFTRDRIARLRSEADALEKTLKEYTSAKARISGASRRSGSDNPRGGAFGAIMDAIRAAGIDGLTLDQMIDVAADEGFEVKRNTLRSQIWTAKNDGDLEQVKTGVYRIAGAAELTSGRIEFSRDLDDEMPPRRPAREEFTPLAEGPAPDRGFSSGPLRAAPREEFSHDLDDEIPF
ncbi:hypothetical protein [Phenylobacterium sp.]|uniref:hypothetical protein n=1 Tax=Phenylobacterium sp. TaxID=1871053 RepID=UPI0025F27023|nr:hypothetical protein [Phenylobacterium sp.]